jgi:hypothetical protein
MASGPMSHVVDILDSAIDPECKSARVIEAMTMQWTTNLIIVIR